MKSAILLFSVSLGLVAGAGTLRAEDPRGKNAKSSEAKNENGEDGEAPKKDRWSRLRTGDWDLTLQPAAVDNAGVNTLPAFEILDARPRLGRMPLHVGLAYWGLEMDQTRSSNFHDESADYFGDFGSKDWESKAHYSMHVGVLRAKMFLSPGFYMNFGLGYRYARTRETFTYADGSRESDYKEAASIGVDWGVGNRFYIGRWYYVGAQWVDFFVPVEVLKKRNAKAGADVDIGQGTRTHDGWRVSFRTLALEAGRLF